MQNAKKKKKERGQEPPAPMLSPFCPTYTFLLLLSVSFPVVSASLPGWSTRNFTTLAITHVHSPEANRHSWALILNLSVVLVYQPRPAKTSQGSRVSLTGWPKVNFPILPAKDSDGCSQFSLFSCLGHNHFLPHLLFSVYCTQALLAPVLFRTQGTRLPRNCWSHSRQPSQLTTVHTWVHISGTSCFICKKKKKPPFPSSSPPLFLL